MPRDRVDLAELLTGRGVIGGPEECADEVTRLVRPVGLGRLVCRVQWMGMSESHATRETFPLTRSRTDADHPRRGARKSAPCGPHAPGKARPTPPTRKIMDTR